MGFYEETALDAIFKLSLMQKKKLKLFLDEVRNFSRV